MKDHDKIIAYLKDRLPQGAVVYFDQVKDKVVVEIGDQTVSDGRDRKKRPSGIDLGREVWVVVKYAGLGIRRLIDIARTNPPLAFLIFVFVISVAVIIGDFLGL